MLPIQGKAYISRLANLWRGQARLTACANWVAERTDCLQEISNWNLKLGTAAEFELSYCVFVVVTKYSHTPCLYLGCYQQLCCLKNSNSICQSAGWVPPIKYQCAVQDGGTMSSCCSMTVAQFTSKHFCIFRHIILLSGLKFEKMEVFLRSETQNCLFLWNLCSSWSFETSTPFLEIKITKITVRAENLFLSQSPLGF